MSQTNAVEKQKASDQHIVISAPNFKYAEFQIVGTAPLVINRFSVKAGEQMARKQAEGKPAGNKKNRVAKDFDQIYKDAMYISKDGWYGISASAFRCAAISACRVSGFMMTKAKLTFHVVENGFDKDDQTGLVKITKGKPEMRMDHVRLETGVADIRSRPMWAPGWEAKVTIRWDADQFTLEDVTNLMMRVGMQVGIGEGRPDSKKSAGMGWGLFELKGNK